MIQVSSLLALPGPILDESPASWMMRLCQYHQSWPNQICSALDLQKMVDFDIQLSSKQLHRLAYGTPVDDTALACLERQFSHIRDYEKRCLAFLLHGSPKGCSTYRYCPDCLRDDSIPYWRLTWRMAYFQVCPKHYCVMLDHCLACNAMLEAFPTRKGGFFEGADQPICRFCPACRSDLGTFGAERLPDCEKLYAVLALQRVVTAALLHGYFSVYGVAGRFALELLPRMLMLGATGFDASDGTVARTGYVTRRLVLGPHTQKKKFMKAGKSDKRMVTSRGYHPDDLPRSANMAWKVRFLNAIDEIRQVGNRPESIAGKHGVAGLNI